MSEQEIRLGPEEVKLLFTLEKEGEGVFEFSHARAILGSTEPAAWNVIYRLKKKGRVKEIEKGTYLLVPARAGLEGHWSELPFLVVPHLIEEYYIGYWTALNHWNLTEQNPRTVFVATTKRKRDVAFGPTTFQFVTLAERKFFGYTEQQMAGSTFQISDREKTLIDCLDIPDYAGGYSEVVKAIWEGRDDLDFDKLLRYAERYAVNVLVRRLGYLLDLLDLAESTRDEIEAKELRGYMWLDPTGPKDRVGYSKAYGLTLNRTEDELLAWRGS